MATLNLSGASNAEIAKADDRLTSRVARIKDAAKRASETTMGLLIAGLGGGAAGAFMGHRSATIEMDDTLTEEEKQEAGKLFGVVEPDLAVGLVLTLGSMFGGKMAGQGALDAGTGVLGYYAGNRGFKTGQEEEAA